MRRPLYRALAAVLCSLPVIVARPAAAQSDPFGSRTVDYLRISGGWVSPVSPSGSLRNWGAGYGIGVAWDTWQRLSDGGPGRAGFGLTGSFSLLPFDKGVFLPEYLAATGQTATSATASAAKYFDVQGTFRVRLPSYLVTPTVVFGGGYYSLRPSSITVTTATGSTEVEVRKRSGVSFTGGLGVERPIVGSVGVFAEGIYTHGLRQNQGQLIPTSQCSGSVCDAIASTRMATVRAGARIHVAR